MPRANFLRVVLSLLLLAIAAIATPRVATAASPSMADLDASARAEGNRRAEALKIGRVLFATIWPVQITHVRVEGVGRHTVAGLILSAVKFHEQIDRAGFLSEIELLIGRTFSASDVEEVDVWATVPIPYDAREPVSGDLAKPTSRTVFAVTCRRDQFAALTARLRSDRGVYWSDDFRSKLLGRSR